MAEKKARTIVHIELEHVDEKGGVYLRVATINDIEPRRVKLDKEYKMLTITEKR